MATFDKINCRVVANSFDADPLVKTWTDRVMVQALDTDSLIGSSVPTELGKNLLMEAYQEVDELPVVGDIHPVLQNACCSRVTVRPAPGNMDSPDSVHADVSWIMPHVYENGVRARAIVVSQYQLQEIRNFDNVLAHTRVKYKIVPSNPRFPVDRIADIRVPRTMYSIKITQYENISGGSLSDLVGLGGPNKFPVYNNGDWQGFPNSTMLWLGKCVDYQGIPVARVQYDFLTNDRGWNKFVAVYTQQNGYVPQDLGEIPDGVTDPNVEAIDLDANGIGFFDMLDFANFDDDLPNLTDLTF